MSPQFPQVRSIGNIPVLIETSNAIPLVHISVATRRGAATDPPGGDGLTRLTARLMRRTAGGIPLTEIERRLDRLGISLGADTTYSNMSLVRRGSQAFLRAVPFDPCRCARQSRPFRTRIRAPQARNSGRNRGWPGQRPGPCVTRIAQLAVRQSRLRSQHQRYHSNCKKPCGGPGTGGLPTTGAQGRSAHWYLRRYRGG